MSTKKEKTYEIVDGPSVDRLFDACKYAYNRNTHIDVDFSVAVAYTLPKSDPRSTYIKMAIKDMCINMIQHESGSGDSFNIKGYCTCNLSADRSSYYEVRQFKAYYNTKTRKGTMTLY